MKIPIATVLSVALSACSGAHDEPYQSSSGDPTTGSSGSLESGSSSSGSGDTTTSGAATSKSGSATAGSASTGHVSSGTIASMTGSSGASAGAASSSGDGVTSGSSTTGTDDAGTSHRDAGAVELSGCAAQVPSAIFGQSCEASNCHNSKDHEYALDLQSPGVATRLVNQPSLEIGTYLLIDPNDWTQSYILLKCEQTQPPAGSQMPQQGTKLDSAQIACLQQWVKAEAAGPY